MNENNTHDDPLGRILQNLSFENIPAPLATLALWAWLVCARARNRGIGSIQVPMLALIAPPGSGKTALARRLGRLVTGNQLWDVSRIPKDEEDLWIRVTAPGVFGLDNVDQRPPSWLHPTLAVFVTGGRYERRKLYTNDELVSFECRQSLILTGINPALRGEMIERSLVLRLNPLAAMRSERALAYDDIANQPALVEQLDLLTNNTLKALFENSLPKPPRPTRLVDYASAMVVVAYSLTPPGQAMDWVAATLEALAGERLSLLMDGDPLVAALLAIADGPHAGELLRVRKLLDLIEEEMGGVGAPMNVRQLGHALREIREDAAGIVRIEKSRKAQGVKYRVTKVAR